MKSIIVDKQTFLKNPDFFVNGMLQFDDEITKEDMLRTIEFNGFYFFAFDDDDKLAAWGRCAKTYGRKTMWCIRQIQTKEEYQRQGYAELLYKECEKFLTNNTSVKRIYAFVDENNFKSIKFHEKMGYDRVERVSKEIRQMHGWDSAIMFEKKINRCIAN